MSVRRLAAVAALCVAVGAAIAIVVVMLLGGDEPDVSAPARPVAAEATLTPREHGPGDLVTATLALAVDTRLVDPSEVQVEAGFRPYTRVAPVEVLRTDAGSSSLLEYVYRLQCLDRACVLGAGSEATTFAPAVVRYPDATVGQATLAVDWPSVTMTPRVPGDAVDDPQFRAASEPEPATYGISPSVLGWLLAGAAAALVLAAGIIVWRLLRRQPAPVAEPVVSAGDETVAAALAEVARTRGGDEDERRVALDTLARRLDGDGREELARDARRLAWSRATPEGKPLDELCEAVGAAA